MTRSAPIDALLDAIEAKCGGQSAPQMKQALLEAEALVAQIGRVFDAQKRFRERTPLFIAQERRVRKAFRDMKKAFSGIRQGELKEGARLLAVGFDTMMEAMDALRVEEDARPVYCRSAYMNVVMRLAHGVARGTIELDALRQALSEMLVQLRRFTAVLDGVARPGGDAERYKQKRKEIKSLLSAMESAMVLASKTLNETASKDVTHVLERAAKAADALVVIQGEFETADDAARMRPCIRCGAANERTQRHCAKCGAMLPPIPVQDDHGAAIDLTVEDRVRRRGHVETEWTQKLQRAVTDVQSGRISRDRFGRVLDDAESRLRKARNDFDKLPVPGGLTEQQQEVLQQAAAVMRTGLMEVEEGLHGLRAYLVDGNVAHLEHGLEATLAGGDKLIAVQRMTSDRM